MATVSLTPASTVTLTLEVTLRRVVPVTGSSTAATADAVTATRIQTASGSSTLTTGSTATYVLSFSVTGASSAVTGSTGSAVGVFHVSQESVFTATSTAFYTGIAQDVWTINVNTNAVSRYTEFDYNSVVNVDGRTFVLDDSGIYELTGEVDGADNLKVYFESPAQRVENHILSPRYAYIIGKMPENKDVAAPGLKFQIMTDDRERYEYDIDPTTQDMETSRVVFGRGLRSRHIRYSVKGEINEDVTFTSIDVYFDETRRGIK